MRSCKNCGCVNDNINRYCRNCGSFLEENMTAPAPEAAVQEKEPSPEEYLPTDETTETAEKDFFDLDPIPPALFDPSAEYGTPLFDGNETPPPDNDYIDFDLGEEAEDETGEVEPTPCEKVASVTRSPLYLIFAVFASVGLALTLLRMVFTILGKESVVGMGTPFSDLVDMLFIAGFDRVSAYTAALMGAPVYYILQIFALAPAILYIIGVWLHYAGIKKRRTAGLNLFFAGNIVSLSGFGLSAVVCCAVGLSLLISVIYAPAETVAHFVGLILLVGVMSIVSFFGVLYSGFAIVTVNRMKKVLKWDVPEHKLSVFVMVMNLLLALSLSSTSGFYMAGSDYLSFALSVVNMITYVLITMVMVRYRIELK